METDAGRKGECSGVCVEGTTTHSVRSLRGMAQGVWGGGLHRSDKEQGKPGKTGD